MPSWNRRQFLGAAGASLAVGSLNKNLLWGQQAAQTPPAPAFTSLRGNVGLFTGRGGNIGWFVSSNAVVVIDTQFPDTAKICLEGINERSKNRALDYLMNTHHHGDHTAGNGVFRATAKKIVAHARCVEAQKAAAAKQNQEAQQTYADTTFTDAWKADLGGEMLSAKYYGPAHTSGDIAICFEKANVVHLGDLLFNRRHPFIDRPAGASIAGWIQVLDKIVADHTDDTLYIFGHHKPDFPATGKKADLHYMRDYLSALLDFVRSEMKAGKSRDIIVKSNAELKGFPDHGPLIERVVSVAFDELTAG